MATDEQNTLPGQVAEAINRLTVENKKLRQLVKDYQNLLAFYRLGSVATRSPSTYLERIERLRKELSV